MRSFFIFQPSEQSGPLGLEDEHYICLTDENAYVVLNEDGSYDLYLYGEYIETVTSLEEYDSSLPVYTTGAPR